VRPQISQSAIDYSWERYRNPTPPRETSSVPIRKRISPTASCAWQICRRAPSIVSAATNTCCGGKRDRLCLRWSRCGAASDSRAVQPFHSRSGGASPARCPKSSGDHSRSQRRARRLLLWRLRRTTLIETNLFQLQGRFAMKQSSEREPNLIPPAQEWKPFIGCFAVQIPLCRRKPIQPARANKSRSRRSKRTTELLELSQSSDNLLAAMQPSQLPDQADQSVRDGSLQTSGSNALHS
jgi:hypothetical protein